MDNGLLSAALCHCWINPISHRLTEVIRLSFISSSSFVILLGRGTWGIKTWNCWYSQRSNVKQPAGACDNCWICVSVVHSTCWRNYVPILSVCCLQFAVIKERSGSGLLGMLHSFCMKEQIITVFPFTGTMCSSTCFRAVNSSLWNISAGTGCSSDASKCHICHSFPVFVVLLWASLRREAVRPSQTSPRWWFLCVTPVQPKRRMWQSFVSPVKFLLEVQHKTTGSWLLQNGFVFFSL